MINDRKRYDHDEDDEDRDDDDNGGRDGDENIATSLA